MDLNMFKMIVDARSTSSLTVANIRDNDLLT